MTTLPAGVYYVGDPCYTVQDTQEHWINFLNHCDLPGWSGSGTWRGSRFWVSNTLYGDGVYGGSDGFDYPVDAGLIGAIPLELCVKFNKVQGVDFYATNFLGRMVEFKSDFQCSENGGLITIGNIMIDTR